MSPICFFISANTKKYRPQERENADGSYDNTPNEGANLENGDHGGNLKCCGVLEVRLKVWPGEDAGHDALLGKRAQ